MELQSNELRIGNYVYNDKNQVYRITWINDSVVYKINPIPLTDEWLVKFGFRNDIHEKYYYLDLHDGYYIFKHEFFAGISFGKETTALPIELNYVHQLQNLHFTLTGYELTLKN